MTRVSENSHTASINYSINKAKTKMEDLQLKGSALKRIMKPSDDPSGNIQLMELRSNKMEYEQFKRNATFAETNLEYTENSIKDLTEIMNKAKEIAIGQASDLYNPQVRQSVAKEVAQLRKQAMGIANRRLGNRYVFSGFKTLERPFNNEGKYGGDSGIIYLEILKDFYVPTNIPGNKVFYLALDSKTAPDDPLAEIPKISSFPKEGEEGEAMVTTPQDRSELIPLGSENHTLFNTLRALEDGLMTDNSEVIQNLLPEIDEFTDQLITLRTSIGATMNSIMGSGKTLEDMDLFDASRKTKIEDADVAELFSDLQKQGHLLEATYRTSSKILNENLLDFLK